MARETWRQQHERIRPYAPDAVITVAALERLGVPSNTAYRRCQPGGPWCLLLPGVVLLHVGHPSARQRDRAALLYAGAGAQLTGAAAAVQHGLRRLAEPDRVHVLVPVDRRRRSAGFTLVERTERLPEPVTVQGLPCAPPVRAVLDHARRLREPNAVRGLLAEAVQRRFCTPQALVSELAAGSTRGTALVRRELREIVGGARSVAEVRARRLAARTGLPAPLWNVRLVTPEGWYVGTPDAWWPAVGLAWEIDSREYHLSPDDHARTLRRNARYAEHGIAMLPTLPSRLVHEPAAVMRELRSAYEAAARGPVPTVLHLPLAAAE